MSNVPQKRNPKPVKARTDDDNAMASARVAAPVARKTFTGRIPKFFQVLFTCIRLSCLFEFKI